MAIQSQLNYNASNTNQVRFPLTGGGSEFSLVNNNGGFGIGNNQSYINSTESMKDFTQQTLFHQNLSQSFLAYHMEKQKQEIDQLIRIQNERLRYVLQEQSKQMMEMILRKMETKALVLMNQKEEEISKALSKNMELEDMLRKMEVENQKWQRIARDNEAMVTTLNSKLEQVRERTAVCQNDAAVEDEGSSCGGGGDSFPVKKMISCLNCGSNGETRVLFLPCRHLCCCTDCEASLVLCPICNTPKKNSIEAYYS